MIRKFALLLAIIFSFAAVDGVSQDPLLLSLSMNEPYMPNTEFRDDYRCFLVDPELADDVMVKAYNIEPGLEEIVHHVVLYVAGPTSVPGAVAADEADPGPGWTCFGGPGIINGEGVEAILQIGRDFSRSLGTWIPGSNQSIYPTGTGKPFEAGSQLVMQVHYNLQGIDPSQVRPDLSSAKLTLSEPGEQLESLRFRGLIAPVELRCPGPYPQNRNDPCHRDYALSQVNLPGVADIVHVECSSNPNDFIERDIGFGDAQEFSCTVLNGSQGLILGVFNHMHLRGRSITIELNPNTPSYQMLHHNPAWNFNNQEGVWFEEPVQMNFGDLLKVTCVFDNSGSVLGPDGQPLEPRFVTWGEGTTDEMCLGGIHWIRN